MSLDFDRSPDGEPPGRAGQPPVPAQQAPATSERPSGSVPTFTPAAAAADSESADDESAAGERAARQPEPAADDHEAGEPATYEPATYYPTTYERAAGEPAATEPAADEPGALRPAGEPGALTPASEPAVTDAAAGEPAASEPMAYGSGAAPAWDARRDGVAEDPGGAGGAGGAASRPAGRAAGIGSAADLDGPLLSDADELRASWQRIQAAFVDDPREAVADAAGLVEHTAQALAGALRQRQRQLRALWDRDGVPDGVEYADSGGSAPGAASLGEDPQAAADGPDTEQLRLLIQRYRVLFNSLCRP